MQHGKRPPDRAHITREVVKMIKKIQLSTGEYGVWFVETGKINFVRNRITVHRDQHSSPTRRSTDLMQHGKRPPDRAHITREVVKMIKKIQLSTGEYGVWFVETGKINVVRNRITVYLNEDTAGDFRVI